MSASRVWFVGGSEAGEEVDSVLWCTGYQKVLGFLSPDCGLNISEEGHLVEPLYLHLLNINYPSMAVMHLNPGNVPFPQMDLQVMRNIYLKFSFEKSCNLIIKCEARAFLRLHFEESLPSQERMWCWLRADTQWRERLGLAPRHRHKLTGGRLMHWGPYMNQLAASADLPPPPPLLERMFLYSVLLVVLEGLAGARNVRFTLNSDRSNFSVSPGSFLVNILYWLLILAIKVGICQ